MTFVVRECFDEKLAGLWHLAAIGLHLQPLAHLIGKARPACAIGQHLPHPVRQMCGERQARTHIAWDIGRRLRRGADNEVEVLDGFHFKRHAGKGERVPRAQRRGEGFFHLAQFAAIAETDFEHRRIDNDAGIKPVLRGKLRVRQPPPAVGVFDQFLEPVIGAQRIATCRDKGDDAGKGCGIHRGVRKGRLHLRQQLFLVKRTRAGNAHDMLRQDVIASGAEGLAIAHPFCHRVIGGLCLQIFKAVAGHEDGLGWLVHPVVRPANPLQQPRASLGRTHLNDAIDIAPVDTQIERGRAHQCAQLAVGHCAFDLAPRLNRQRSVVDADGIFGLIRVPQFLEDKLGEEACVAEYQRDFVAANFVDQLRYRMMPAVPRPRHAAFGE